MKFQTCYPLFLLSAFSVGVQCAEFDSPSVAGPICITFEPIKMVGNGQTIDTNSGLVGDLTIGKYVGTPKPNTGNFSNQGVPNQPGGFSQIETGFDSECIITGPTAPTCTYNFDFSFCRDVYNGQLPFKDCRMGAFSGYGKGPGKIKITGGTDDLFGAFGQVTTTTPFNQGNNLQNSSVEMKIEICYYKDFRSYPSDLYPRVGATEFDVQENLKIVRERIGYFDPNDSVLYNNVNFGPSGTTKSIQVRYSKGNPTSSNQKLQIRLDSETGPLLATYTPLNTGAWTKYVSVLLDIPDNISGYRDVVFAAIGSGSGVIDIEWFELTGIAA
jgi:hypothetical protein